MNSKTNAECRVANAERRTATRACVRWVLVGVGLISLVGCRPGSRLTPCPFHDDLANDPPVTTPSADGVREAGVAARVSGPNGVSKTVLVDDGTVTHRPLYFEDSREMTGSEDGQFAWTREDYVGLAAAPARFLANVFTAPFEMVILPPWRVMASDGYANRKVGWWWVDAEKYDPSVVEEPAVVVVTEEGREQ